MTRGRVTLPNVRAVPGAWALPARSRTGLQLSATAGHPDPSRPRSPSARPSTSRDPQGDVGPRVAYVRVSVPVPVFLQGGDRGSRGSQWCLLEGTGEGRSASSAPVNVL